MSELFASRKILLDNLISLMQNDCPEEHSLTISLDAGWGFGKTFFLEKLAAELEADSQMVVRFNAWGNDISEDAFISFTDSLITGLSKYLEDSSVFFEKADLAMVSFAKVSLNRITSSIPIVSSVKKLVQETGQEYEKQLLEKGSYFVKGLDKTGLEVVKGKIKESLDEFFPKCSAEYQGKKAFVLIDELDRCRPDFAIQVLERVKHLFSDSRLCFVFAINQEQLEKSVCHSFGQIDTSLYFERFFDYSFILPDPETEEFIKDRFPFSGETKHQVYYNLLSQMVLDAKKLISLRQVEHIFNTFEAICHIVPDFDDYSSSPYLIPWAVFSKIVDNEFFRDIFNISDSSKFYSMNAKSSRFSDCVYGKFFFIEAETHSERKIINEPIKGDSFSRPLPAGYESGESNLLLSNKSHGYTSVSLSKEKLGKIYSLVACLS
ncbi:MAG: hypothetical protein J5785_06285 [Spirochaetales bacterium]|nr:hypothetical protein [Spirochaetales bacterium]